MKPKFTLLSFITLISLVFYHSVVLSMENGQTDDRLEPTYIGIDHKSLRFPKLLPAKLLYKLYGAPQFNINDLPKLEPVLYDYPPGYKDNADRDLPIPPKHQQGLDWNFSGFDEDLDFTYDPDEFEAEPYKSRLQEVCDVATRHQIVKTDLPLTHPDSALQLVRVRNEINAMDEETFTKMINLEPGYRPHLDVLLRKANDRAREAQGEPTNCQ